MASDIKPAANIFSEHPIRSGPLA